MGVNGILLVSWFCDNSSAVSRSISWARCLPVDSGVWVAPFFEKLAHFLTFVVKSESLLKRRLSLRN